MADEQDLSRIREEAIPAGTDVAAEACQFDLEAAQENLEQSRQDRAERKKYASSSWSARGLEQ
jgi:hypothetical protein